MKADGGGAKSSKKRSQRASLASTWPHKGQKRERYRMSEWATEAVYRESKRPEVIPQDVGLNGCWNDDNETKSCADRTERESEMRTRVNPGGMERQRLVQNIQIDRLFLALLLYICIHISICIKVYSAVWPPGHATFETILWVYFYICPPCPLSPHLKCQLYTKTYCLIEYICVST